MNVDTAIDLYDRKQFEDAIPITALRKEGLNAWLKALTPKHKNWVKNTDFKASANSVCLFPSSKWGLDSIVVGLGDSDDYWAFGGLPSKLPEGKYRIANAWDNRQIEAAAIAWGLGAYRFERYKKSKAERPRLILHKDTNFHSVNNQVQSTYRVRELINTPAEDMMPENLAEVVAVLAKQHDASFTQIVGEHLHSQNYPLIHAVGRASTHAPRLIELTWGAIKHPKVTLVGKGVCFDSGGLDIKPAANMRLMKKDMGGAAHVIGLAQMIMEAKLPIRLRVLIPAVENAISGNAYRPGDVFMTRKGLAIEIENTDAEGRLVLCDALTEAESDSPQLVIDFATLTGAARVALGTELPVFFTNREDVSKGLMQAADRVSDPIWQLPLHRPYRYLLDSDIADIANSASGPFAGAITAALFLEEFISDDLVWVHFDIMGWNTRDRPGRPVGGEAMGVRAVFNYLCESFKGHA